MQKYCMILVFSLLLAGCSFHLKKENDIPEKFKIMSYYSSDPYGVLSRNIDKLFRAYQIKIINKNDGNHYPSLKVTNVSFSKNTVSIYQDGKSAENQLLLIVEAQVVIAGKDIYPIRVRTARSFFDNPATALAKTAEQDLLLQEMYSEAAKQLLAELKTIPLDN